MKVSRQQGFTIPELLVVAGVIFGLLAVALIFAHPRDYSVQNRNNERWLNVSQIMQLISRYASDNGKLPDKITTTAEVISNDTMGIDLCPDFAPSYVKSLPIDPTGGLALDPQSCLNTEESVNIYTTGYTVKKSDDGTVTVAAPNAESGAKISLSRRL